MLSLIIRKILEKLSFFFTNDLDNLKFEDEIIFDNLKDKIDLKPINQENLKNTHKIFNKEIYKLLKKKKLKNFLRNQFIQKMFFVHNRFFIFNELNDLRKNKNWLFYKNLLIEDDVGDPVRYFLYPKSSGNQINHIYHLSQLENALNINLNEIENVFEFGGGYGCMARIFSKINEKVNYTIFDTNLVNCIQYYYLKQNNLDVDFKNAQFSLINNIGELNLKQNVKNSVFLANWSLSEVPIEFRKTITNHIENYEYIMISFQEFFEDINNLDYFENLRLELKNKYETKIVFNKYYKGNIIKRQKHFFLFGKKL